MGDLCVGTTAYIISARGQGILTQVHTLEKYRRQGIANATMDETLKAYRKYGARTVYLAAWTDMIRNMYKKRGFETVGMMGERHALKLTLNESGKDENLFRSGQNARFRPMEKGDQADLSSLFNTRHECVVKHYDLGCFLGSHFEGEFFILQNQIVTGIVPEETKEKKGFKAVMLDGEETILGLGTVIPSSRRHEQHTGILDMLIHGNYSNHMSEMLDRLEQDCELDHLTVYLEAGEEDKCEVFEHAGYKKLSTLEKQLCIGTEYFDLISYRKHFH